MGALPSRMIGRTNISEEPTRLNNQHEGFPDRQVLSAVSCRGSSEGHGRGRVGELQLHPGYRVRGGNIEVAGRKKHM